MNLSLFVSNKNDEDVDNLIKFCKNYFNVLEVFDDNNYYNENKYDDENNFYVSFLNPYIITDEKVISRGCINFHPSTPKCRGVCGASLALYNEDIYFGVTTHYIDNKIDNGQIIDVSYFKIPENINCLELHATTKKKALNVCKNLLENIKAHNTLPKPNAKMTWGNTFMTRKKFKEWITIDLNEIEDINEIKKKIKSCANSKFDGPFLILDENKYKIEIMEENDS